jgi:PhnB protein
MEVDDAFWGDRMGMLKDPFGHIWMVATHKEDVSPEQLEKRAEEFFSHQKQPA